MSDEVTPARTIIKIWQWSPVAVIGSIVAFAVILPVVIIGWQVGWWFTAQNAQRQAHVVQSNYNVQEGYVSRISDDVGAIDANIATAGSTPDAGMTAQNIHSGSDACHYASLLVPGEVTVDPSMAQWIRVNCAVGALAPTSTVYKGSNGA
jgi:hypothetical protein